MAPYPNRDQLSPAELAGKLLHTLGLPDALGSNAAAAEIACELLRDEPDREEE